MLVRQPWRQDFPKVFVHCAWEGGHPQCLPDHPMYWPAKKARNANAALRVCDEIAQEPVLEALHDTCLDHSQEADPIVVAPSLTPHEARNALSIGYGRWLAKEMGWEVARDIFQVRTVNRDFVVDGWFRFANQPEYDGTVEAGRNYVIADDVCTMGGTLASLRGFIEAKGARVICMTTLASRDGSRVKISLAQPTISRLSTGYDGELDDLLCREMGYGLGCLTDPEGRFLLQFPTLERIREGIHGARQP